MGTVQGVLNVSWGEGEACRSFFWVNEGSLQEQVKVFIGWVLGLTEGAPWRAQGGSLSCRLGNNITHGETWIQVMHNMISYISLPLSRSLPAGFWVFFFASMQGELRGWTGWDDSWLEDMLSVFGGLSGCGEVGRRKWWFLHQTRPLGIRMR